MAVLTQAPALLYFRVMRLVQLALIIVTLLNPWELSRAGATAPQSPDCKYCTDGRPDIEIEPAREVLRRVLRPPTASADARDFDEQKALATLDPEARKFFDLINDYRRENGVSPLHLSLKLTRSAQFMTADMAAHDWDPPPGTTDIAAHADSKGRLPYDRNLLFGYTDTTYAENLVAGVQTAQEAFEAWRHSPGHNRNMLNPRMRAIGIAWTRNSHSAHFGAFATFWCTDFGSQLDQEIIPWPAAGRGK